MNIFIMLVVLLAQQAVWANGTLTHKTRHLLKTGLLFKLEKTITTDVYPREHYVETIKQMDAIERRVALREIYLKPNGVNQAREIVETEHGAEELNNFNYMLKLQEEADLLGVDVDLKTAMVIRIAMRDN